jgi:gliding motility-associated-like protein
MLMKRSSHIPCLNIYLIALLLFTGFFGINAQNLAKNGSFEKFHPDFNPTLYQWQKWPCVEVYHTMAAAYIVFFNDQFNQNKVEFFPSGGVPFNSYGYQFARTGSSYCVSFGDFYGAPVFPLASPLEHDICYNVRFYVSRSDRYRHASDAVNGYFSRDSITIFMLAADTIKPQVLNPNGVIYDTMNWVPIHREYIASGGEKYFAVSSFFSVARSNLYNIDLVDSTIILRGEEQLYWLPHWNGVYYLDDVAIWECGAPEYPADAGPDKKICAGEQAELGNNIPRDQYLYFWSDRSWHGPRHTWDTLAASPKFTVSPTKTTTYYLWSIDFKWEHTYDSVTVYVENCDIDLEIPNVFTPNGDGYNDYFMIRNPNQVNYTLEVFNRWGNLVFQGNQNYFWNGTFNEEPAPAGVYFYILTATTPDGTFKKEFHGSVTILR